MTWISWPLVVVCVATLSACGTDGPDALGDVTVVAEDWNGWDPDHESTPETTTFAGQVGGSATVDGLAAQVRIEVTHVRDDAVEISTSSPMAPETDSGGADLNGLEQSFVVPVGEQVVFSTPTLDAGVTFTVSVADAAS